MLKNAAKSAIATLSKKLPWGGQRALLHALIKEAGPSEVFSEIGRSLSVQSVTASGEYGIFEGPLDDLAILGGYMQTGSWSRETVRFFVSFFTENGAAGTYFDIGANIGLTLIPIARLPRVRCYAFEPDPKSFTHLKRNIQLNNIENVDAFNIALFNCAGTMSLALSKSKGGAHHIRRSAGVSEKSEKEWPTVEIKTVRLDSIIDAGDLTYPLAVKIDTEGAEPFIIAGGRSILEHASALVMEFSPYTIKRMGGDASEQIAFIESTFSEGAIVKGPGGGTPVFEPISYTAGELRKIWEAPHSPHGYYDIFARK